MRILIIEDELQQIRNLKSFFEDSFPDFHVDVAISFEDARMKIIQGAFDIGIFDIFLRGKSIFELLEGVHFSQKEIIFITGNNEFALKAFQCYAVDYITKPYDTKRLALSVKIASDRINKTQDITNSARIPSLSTAIVQNRIDYIALPNLNGITLVPIKEIIAVEAARSYSTFHLTNKETITISRSLNWAEKILISSGFFRVHRSWIVSRYHITEFHKQNGYSIRMVTGLVIGIADNARSRVFEWVKSFTIMD